MKRKIKNSLMLILFIFGITLTFGQTTTIDFETVDDGYTPSITEGSGFTDVFNRTDPNIGGNNSFMWSVEDMNSVDPSLTLDQIDVTGSTSFTFAIDMIAHHYNDWDVGEELLITYSIDGGADQNLMWVQNTGGTFNEAASLDTDFDGNGDCGAGVLPALTTGTSGCIVTTNTFQTFTTTSVPLSSNTTLDIKLQFNGFTATDEGIYLDNLVIIQSGSGVPTVGFDTPTNSIVEADSGTSSFTAPITMNTAPSSDVVINVTLNDGTATIADNDYSGPASNDLTFTTGATYPLTLNADFTIIGDTSIETDEDFTLDFTITSGTANTGTTTHTVTITNDDSYNNCFTDNDDFEKVEVTTNSDTDVWLFSGGTYNMNGFCGSGCSEESNQWLILGDLDLSSYTGSEILQLVLDANEGFDGTDLTINITDTYTGCPDDAGNSWLTLGTITSSGTAQTFDMSAASGSGSVYIGIQYFDNDTSNSSWDLSNIIIETDNASCFTINTPVASNCVLIPTVSFDTSSSSVIEGDTGSTSHNIAVSISEDPLANVVVDIITNEVTATEDTDYTGTLVSLTFMPGGALTQNVSIPIIGDTDIEASETFTTDLTLSSGIANIGTNSHTTTITDNDSSCPNVGDLIFSEIMQNPTVTSDANGEWLEIYNTTGTAIEMLNMIIKDDATGSETHTISSSLVVPGYGFVLLALNGDNLLNGNINEDYVYDSISLGNSSDGIILECNGTIIDQVNWDGGATFPDPLGRSMTLRTAKYNSSDNDLGNNWCEGTSVYGDGDFGTPGIANDDCKCVDLQTVIWTAGAWSNGTGPTIDSKVIIEDAFTTGTNGDFESCNCEIDAGITLTISANGFLKTESDITNNGTIIVENTGSIVQISDNAIVTGTDFQIQKTTTPYVMYDYTYWSSPVESADLGTVFAANLANQIYDFTTANFDDADNDTFDDNNDDWNIASGTMVDAKGYIVMGEGAVFPVPSPLPTTTSQQAVSFNGRINNGVKTIALTLDGNASDSFDNQNLIGNPYPSAIDAVKLLNATTNPNLSGTLYFWTHNTQVSSSTSGPDAYNFTNDDYMTYVSGTGFVAGACSGCVVPGDDLIASGQGFFADVSTAGIATFNNDMRVTTGNDNFFRSSQTRDRIWVNFTNEEGLFRQTLVGFFADATNGHDRNYDGKRLANGNNFDFYTLMDNNRYAIQGFTTLSNDKTVSLGVEATVVGDFQISIDHLEGDLENVNVYLKDNLLNTIHNLKTSNYNLTINQIGEFNERFELFFSRTALSVNNDELVSENDLIVSNLNDDIHLEILNGNIIRNIKAFDIIGKLIFESSPNNNNVNIRTNVNKGTVLFIKVQLENGQTLTKKFIKL